MNQKPSFTEKVLRFLDGKAFYLVVLACVAVVGLSGWYLVQGLGGEDDPAPSGSAPVSGGEDGGSAQVSGELDDRPGESGSLVSGGAEIEVTLTPPPELDDGPAVTARPTMPADPVETGDPAETPQPSPPAQPTVDEPDPAPLVFTWPVKGEVLKPHDAETLVYDETMADWRVHTGMDIAAAAGTNVLAAAAGTVTAVDHHDLMGTTVVIDHGQGLVSRYSNLQAVPTVEVGDQVYTGSIIGAVGSTAIAESAVASHLHFELSKDGASVDPMGYLPAQ